MTWKNWPYWLKGGIYTAIFGLVLDIIFLIGLKANIGFLRDFLSRAIYQNIFLPIIYLFIQLKICDPNNCIVSPFLFIVELFLLGAILGLIIGKIKK